MGEGAEQITEGSAGRGMDGRHSTSPWWVHLCWAGTLTPTAGPGGCKLLLQCPQEAKSRVSQTGLSPRLCQALTWNFHGPQGQGVRTSPMGW